MLDEAGSQVFFEQIHTNWIEPEISQRRLDGKLPDNFMIYRCLIRLPKNKQPIVEFNNEIRWVAKPELAPGISMEKGREIFLHEIQGIKEVLPPQVDEQNVAFVYLYWTGHSYSAVFDFSPNVPDELRDIDANKEFHLGKVIADDIEAIITERSIYIYDDMQAELQSIGLWAAPSLLPYPMAKIMKLLDDGDVEAAKGTLIEHCTPEFIENLSSEWWNIQQFKDREGLIIDALAAHKEGRYRLSIPALLPQIEGIVTDWIYTKVPEEEVPWRTESKTRKFRDIVFDEASATYTYKRIVESTIEFILEGPVLTTFKNWFGTIDTAFPNRHVVEHGKYDDSLYIEENSIKLFLLLDTVYRMIST